MKKRSTRAVEAAGLFDELLVDNFAGGGGASLGIELAIGRAVDLAINHDRAAIEMHMLNHPHTRHLCEDVWHVDPYEATGGRPVGLAWFSPDCKHFSRAKGGKPVEKKIRGLAWVVIRWARSVRPRLIMLENVREFQDWGPLQADNRPDPQRKGITFRRWVGCLRNLGYAVEWRVLNAADFGAPTHRRRLFIVARCDGRPIVWPESTHGPGRARAWRTAAECIDWSIPCLSIFDRPRPLAEKTLRRIAMGLRRYVLQNPRPFIVRADHGGEHFRGQELEYPLGTVTSRHGYGLVTPYVARVCQNGSNTNKVDEPLRTVVSKNEHCLVVPHLTQFYGEAPHQNTRGQRADEPLRTVVPAPKHALVTAFLAKHYGGVIGHDVHRPIGTVTAKDHHGLVAANLVHFNHGEKQWSDVREPMRTLTTGKHAALVYSFLTKYYSTGAIGQELEEPLHTVTHRGRFGLVTVEIAGEPWVITDIGLRMLQPRELSRAQGFPDSYVLPGSKSNQVARIGNSVPPELPRALVLANYVGIEAEAVA